MDDILHNKKIIFLLGFISGVLLLVVIWLASTNINFIKQVERIKSGEVYAESITRDKLSDEIFTKVNLITEDGEEIQAEILEGEIKDGYVTGQIELKTEDGQRVNAAVTSSSTEFSVENGSITEEKLSQALIKKINQSSETVINTDFEIKDRSIVNIKLAKGTITHEELADGSVITSKILNGAISGEKLQSGSVASYHLGNYIVSEVKMADNAVSTRTLLTGAVTNGKIADSAITTSKVMNAAITEIKLADGSVTTAKIQDASIINSKIVDGTITEAKLADGVLGSIVIEDGSVTEAKLAPGSVSLSKLSQTMCSTGQVLKKLDATTWGCTSDLTGVETLVAGDGIINVGSEDHQELNINVDNSTLEIVTDVLRVKDGGITSGNLAANSVGSSKILDGSVGVNELASQAVTNIKLGDGSVTASKIQDGTITNGKIADGTILSTKISDSAIIESKINNGAVTEIKLASGSVSLSKLSTSMCSIGEILKKTGATTWACAEDLGGSGFVASVDDGAGLSNSGTASEPILDVNTDGSSIEIFSDSLRIKDAGVTEAKIASLAVTEGKIATGAVTNSKIGNLSISEGKIQNGAISQDKLATNSVSGVKIVDGAVTSVKILDGTILNADLADNSISEGKIQNSAVTASKIADDSISLLKLSTVMCGTGQILKKSDATTWGCAEDIGGSGYVASIVDGDGIVNTGTASEQILGVNVDGTTIEIVSDALQVIDGSINSTKITDGTIANTDIALAAAIDWSKISKSGSSLADLGVANFSDISGRNASLVALTDAGGYFTDDNVESALQELASSSGLEVIWEKTGSDIYYNSGKVGIGNNNPLNTLHITGSGAFGDSVTVTNAPRALNLVSTDATMRVLRISSDIDLASPALELLHRTTSDGSNTAYWDFVVNSDGFNIRDRLGTTQPRFTIDTDGDVGIGNVDPTALLSVGDSEQFKVNSSGDITAGSWQAMDIGLAHGGTGANLSDPNADRILFWDDDAGGVTWLDLGANISITGTSLDVVNDYGFWVMQDGDTNTYNIEASETFQIAEGNGIDSDFTAENILTISLTDTGIVPGTYTSVTVDEQGRITAGTTGGSSTTNLTITLDPEYPGGTLTKFYGAGTDTDTSGTMTADVESVSPFHSYYNWESSQGTMQYYTVGIRVTLPSDFSSWQTVTDAIQISYKTSDTTAANNSLRYYIYTDAGTLVYSDTAGLASSTWATSSIADTSLSNWNTAGSTAIIYLRMGATGSGNWTRIGDIKLNYVK